ncbi:MAG: CoA transferase, partial [Candidatus Binatia bacterium]
MMDGRPPLDGTLVIDLSVGIAGGYCTKLLADGGGEVLKIEPPEGDPLRRWTASGARIADGDDGALFQFLAGSKQSIVADPDRSSDVDLAGDLVRGADLVVWTPGSRLAEHPEFSPRALAARAPRAVVAAITPFGLEGPWAGRAATSFTVQAWSGGPGQRGAPDRPPVVAGGRIDEWIAGTFAAVGILSSRWRTSATGRGELLDVSMLESSILTHAMHPVSFFTIAGRPYRANRTVNLPDVHRAKDGYVGFMVVTGQQWFDFCAMIGRSEWREDESLLRFDRRSARRAELWPVIQAWMSERTISEIIELAAALRIPVAEVGTGATIPTFDHFVERKFFVRNPRGGFLQPDV